MKQIHKTIYDAIPNKTTWDDLADGIVIKFKHEGKEYSFNSHDVRSNPRTTPLDTYMDSILEYGEELTKQ